MSKEESEKARKYKDELTRVDEYKAQILEILDGEIRTAKEIAENLGVVRSSETDDKNYSYFLSALDNLQDWYPERSKDPQLKLAVRLGAKFDETYYYYRVDQEEKFVTEGILSEQIKVQSGFLSLKELQSILDKSRT